MGRRQRTGSREFSYTLPHRLRKNSWVPNEMQKVSLRKHQVSPLHIVQLVDNAWTSFYQQSGVRHLGQGLKKKTRGYMGPAHQPAIGPSYRRFRLRPEKQLGNGAQQAVIHLKGGG